MISLGTNRISFSVINTVLRNFISLTSLQLPSHLTPDAVLSEWLTILNNEEVVRSDFHKVKIAVDMGQSVLIPEELFDPFELETYVQFNAMLKDGDEAFDDIIPSIESHNVYSFPVQLNNSLRSQFHQPKIFHASTAFISARIEENKSTIENRLFVELNGENMDMLAFEHGSFIFYNSFKQTKTKEDFIYYLLAVCEQLNFNPEHINATLTGDLKEDSGFLKAGQQYLKHFSFGERPQSFKYSEKIEKFPAHQFYPLFSIGTCE